MVEQASDVLGQDLDATFNPDDPDIFASNRNIQIGVFLANHIHLERLRSVGLKAVASAGMSLGEYNHLVEIGAIGFEDALRLVEARGRLYDAGPAGIMVSFFPVNRDVLEAAIDQIATPGCAEISNENSPKQFVVAGDADTVEALADLIAEQEFIEPTTIEFRIPMHCSRFKPVAAMLAPLLSEAPWRQTERAYLPNVSGKFKNVATPAAITDCLTHHVYSPVLWRQSIETIIARHPDCVFVETGPRRVLCNLLNRRWIRNQHFASDETAPEAIADSLLNLSAGAA